MLLGSGYPQEVAVWSLGRTSLTRKGTRLLNEAHQSAWLPGHECVWKQNGVWEVDSTGVPRLLRADYFSSVQGKPVNFSQDYYRVFNNRFSEAIRSIHPGALIFIENTDVQTPYALDDSDASYVIYAPHWYDGFVLVKKEFTPHIGVNSLTRKVVLTAPLIQRSYRRQLAALKHHAEQQLGGIPFVLGEFGIPFDLHHKQAYQDGNFRIQVKSLQRSMQAVEDNLLNYTLWNYTPDNSNLHGDQWNDEDLSIYSADQRSDPRDINSGGRALQAVVRPYPILTSGELIRASFNPFKRTFKMQFRHDPTISAPTEIFVPNYQYPHGYSIRVSDGRYEIRRSQQLLLYYPGDRRKIHIIKITP
jgi:hypothetical protein